jgi:hypothetical protein
MTLLELHSLEDPVTKTIISNVRLCLYSIIYTLYNVVKDNFKDVIIFKW